MGQSKSHKYEATRQRTTFADVAGIDEAKGELEEVVGADRLWDSHARLELQLALKVRRETR